MPIQTRAHWLRAAALALLLAVAPRLAEAADATINLKISLWVPPAHPLVAAARDWAADIEKASGGSIKATIFPAEQLGKAFDHYDMVRDGIADVGYINPGYQPGRFPIFSRANLPFTIAEGKGGTLAVDAWYRKYAVTEMGDTHLCFAFVQDPGTVFSRRKLVEPGDLKGLKVRPSTQSMGELVTALGGTNVQASAPEARDALERGIADAMTFPWNSIFLFGIDKVTKYAIDMPLYSTAFTWQMNKAMYDNASPAQKKVLDDHCTPEWASRVTDPWVDYEASGKERFRKAPGHEVVELTPAQLASWQDAAAKLRERWAATVKGVDPKLVSEELAAQLQGHHAGF